MPSLTKWLDNWFWPTVGRLFFRLDDIDEALHRTDDRYIDVRGWSRIRGISAEKAKDELDRATEGGFLERCYLYEGTDSPITFVAPAEFLDRSIRLSDIGYIGEDDDREILVDRYQAREVFVARET